VEEAFELVRGSGIFLVVQGLGSREKVLNHVQQKSEIFFGNVFNVGVARKAKCRGSRCWR
jgi:hypothetical protein